MSVPPNVRLARMVLAGVPLDRIGEGDPELRVLVATRRDALEKLAQAARHVDHAAAGPEALDRLRAGFDAAARICPDASVAAYTLGDPDLMRLATGEIVAWLQAHALLGPDRDVLDLGCGTGRVTAAVAPLARCVIGTDVSAEMIAEARRRHPALRFEVTDGRSLCQLAIYPPPLPASPPPGAERGVFGLILAVDSFPYLVQAEVADRHVADAASCLRPGGALAILNLSYRGIDRDRADMRRWASLHGFLVAQNGDQPFTLWDGRAFVLLKPED